MKKILTFVTYPTTEFSIGPIGPIGRLIVNKYTGDDGGRVWNACKRKKPKIQYNEVELQTSKDRKVHHWLAVIANGNQTLMIHREGTHHKKFAQSCSMSFILRYVRVAQATQM